MKEYEKQFGQTLDSSKVRHARARRFPLTCRPLIWLPADHTRALRLI